ncbi:ACT domain-containing protein [Aerococcaceae bacterium WGS1372]
MQAVITVIGKDKVGILASVANQCAIHNANVVDVEQTIMQDYFTMIMLVNIDKLNVDFEEFQQNTKNSMPEMEIHVMHEDIFDSMHRI